MQNTQVTFDSAQALPQIAKTNNTTENPHAEIQQGDEVATTFDRQHNQITVVRRRGTDYRYSPGIDTFPAESYALLGDANGKGILLATDLDDLFNIHSLNLGQAATIAPINSQDAFAVAKALKEKWPEKAIQVLARSSSRGEANMLTEFLGVKALFPLPEFLGWDSYIAAEGADLVSARIINRHEASNISEKFSVTEEQVASISNQGVIFENLIISQHITVMCAAPNAGKTTIMNWVASQVSDQVDVTYINVDCSGADLKDYYDFAAEHRFNLVNFDVSGISQEELLNSLSNERSLESQLYVFDTLKSFADLMNKASTKAFMKKMRQYCNLGATVVLLAHTNKHTNSDGTPVFEGVGDVRADCDELIYLIPDNQPDGSKIVTTLPDKVRGKISPVTFKIFPDRHVTLTDYIDPMQSQREKQDLDLLTMISKYLESGPANQSQIIAHCHPAGFSKHAVMRVLKEYKGGNSPRWTVESGRKNAHLYSATALPKEETA